VAQMAHELDQMLGSPFHMELEAKDGLDQEAQRSAANLSGTKQANDKTRASVTRGRPNK